MPQVAVLPFIEAAERHVAARLGDIGADLVDTARAAASYDFAMLAYGYHPRLSSHCAAMTAAELLCIAARLQRSGGGPPREPEFLPPASNPRALEHDAAVLGARISPLTQDDVARALAHFRQAVEAQGIDLAASLRVETGGDSANDKAIRIPPAYTLPLAPNGASIAR